MSLGNHVNATINFHKNLRDVHYANGSTVQLLRGDHACGTAKAHSSISVYLATKWAISRESSSLMTTRASRDNGLYLRGVPSGDLQQIGSYIG